MFVTRAIGRCSLAPAEDLRHRARHAGGAAFGITTPSAPAASAVQKNCAEIVRIFDPIQYHDQCFLTALGADDIIKIAILF